MFNRKKKKKKKSLYNNNYELNLTPEQEEMLDKARRHLQYGRLDSHGVDPRDFRNFDDFLHYMASDNEEEKQRILRREHLND